MRRVLVTGAGGYVGSKLVPALLKKGYYVIAFDTWWFGDHIPDAPFLRKVKGDIRDQRLLEIIFKSNPVDSVIHMACISNDQSSELDQDISRAINFDAFPPLVAAAKKFGVNRFIFCSTSSVYGVSQAPNVTEDHPLVPLTLYNTTKAQCEPFILKKANYDFTACVIRPSTICGYAPRQRLDLAVNILTNLAVNTGTITVFGGKQMRPNLHIDDMVDCYLMLLEARSSAINGQVFNVGARNYTISDLAEIVREVVEQEYSDKEIKIVTEPLQDERSYQVDSSKITRTLGWRPKYTVEDAIRQLCKAFKEGLLPNSMTDTKYYNVKRMREVWADLYKDAPPPAFDPTKGHLSEIDVHHRGLGK